MSSKLLAPALSTGIDAIGNAVAATVDATCTIARKLLRTAGAILTVTRRHVPAWMGAVLTICLLIPGPVDELLVLLAIAEHGGVQARDAGRLRADRPAGVGRCQRRATSFTAKPPRWRPVTA